MKKMTIISIVAMTLFAMNTMAAAISWRAGILTGTAVNAGSTFTADWVNQTMQYYTVASDFDFAGYKADLAAGNDVSGYVLLAAGSRAISGSAMGEAAATSPNVYAALQTVYGFGIAVNANADMALAGTVDYLISNTLWSGTIAANGATLNATLTGNWTTFDVVPEPTSMALLALGVAALGLRRKLS